MVIFVLRTHAYFARGGPAYIVSVQQLGYVGRISVRMQIPRFGYVILGQV